MNINFTINSKKVTGTPDQTILDVARANGIDIPTLCHHEAVPSWGGCRLCIVEITMAKWEGWSRIVTSCLYPVKEGLIVSTDSPRVKENRKMILNLLMARAPDAGPVKKLAKEYGLTKTTLVKGAEKERCILCGLCTRLCAHQGVYAISTIYRGPDKEINTYWKGPPDDCIGCLVCAKNCSTDAIEYEETKGRRKIWGKAFDLVRCSECGKFTQLTHEQVAFHAGRTGLAEDYFTRCEKCNRDEIARKFLKIIHDPSAGIMEGWGLKPEPARPMPEPTEEWKKLHLKKRVK